MFGEFSWSFLKFGILAIILIIIGIIGLFITRKNLILIIMAIELILLAINLLFVISSIFIDDILGEIFALYILTIAASESAIGLALIVNFYRIRSVIALDVLNSIKG